MNRLIAIAAAILMLWACPALAEEPGLSIDAPRDEIYPGRAVIVSFTVPEDGTCSIGLKNEAGTVLTVSENRTVKAGYNSMYWNGTCDGIPVPEGSWTMTVWMNGLTAETAITVGQRIPCLISVRTENDTVEEGDTVLLSFYATDGGTLLLQAEGDPEPLYWENIAAGAGEAGFLAEMEPGIHELILTLVDEEERCRNLPGARWRS